MKRLTLRPLLIIATIGLGVACTSHHGSQGGSSGGASLGASSAADGTSQNDKKLNPQSKQSQFAKAPKLSSLGQGDEKGSTSGMTMEDTGNVSGNVTGLPSPPHKSSDSQ